MLYNIQFTRNVPFYKRVLYRTALNNIEENARRNNSGRVINICNEILDLERRINIPGEKLITFFLGGFDYDHMSSIQLSFVERGILQHFSSRKSGTYPQNNEELQQALIHISAIIDEMKRRVPNPAIESHRNFQCSGAIYDALSQSKTASEFSARLQLGIVMICASNAYTCSTGYTPDLQLLRSLLGSPSFFHIPDNRTDELLQNIARVSTLISSNEAYIMILNDYYNEYGLEEGSERRSIFINLSILQTIANELIPHEKSDSIARKIVYAHKMISPPIDLPTENNDALTFTRQFDDTRRQAAELWTTFLSEIQCNNAQNRNMIFNLFIKIPKDILRKHLKETTEAFVNEIISAFKEFQASKINTEKSFNTFTYYMPLFYVRRDFDMKYIARLPFDSSFSAQMNSLENIKDKKIKEHFIKTIIELNKKSENPIWESFYSHFQKYYSQKPQELDELISIVADCFFHLSNEDSYEKSKLHKIGGTDRWSENRRTLKTHMFLEECIKLGRSGFDILKTARGLKEREPYQKIVALMYSFHIINAGMNIKKDVTRKMVSDFQHKYSFLEHMTDKMEQNLGGNLAVMPTLAIFYHFVNSNTSDTEAERLRFETWIDTIKIVPSISLEQLLLFTRKNDLLICMNREANRCLQDASNLHRNTVLQDITRIYVETFNQNPECNHDNLERITERFSRLRAPVLPNNHNRLRLL